MTKPGSFYFGFVHLCVNGKTNPVLERSGFVTNRHRPCIIIALQSVVYMDICGNSRQYVKFPLKLSCEMKHYNDTSFESLFKRNGFYEFQRPLLHQPVRIRLKSEKPTWTRVLHNRLCHGCKLCKTRSEKHLVL